MDGEPVQYGLGEGLAILRSGTTLPIFISQNLAQYTPLCRRSYGWPEVSIPIWQGAPRVAPCCLPSGLNRAPDSLSPCVASPAG